MNYQRIIPRDLFNESKLLKCLGHLALKIHDAGGMPPMLPCPMEFIHDDISSEFDINQNPDNGALFVSGCVLVADRKIVTLATDYNSKDPYPLNYNDTDRVFDDNGEFSQAFIDFCKGEPS